MKEEEGISISNQGFEDISQRKAEGENALVKQKKDSVLKT